MGGGEVSVHGCVYVWVCGCIWVWVESVSMWDLLACGGVGVVGICMCEGVGVGGVGGCGDVGGVDICMWGEVWV